jgi:hypothetical protein
MSDVLEKVARVADAPPEGAARIRLRVVDLPKGAPPVVGPSGRELGSLRVQLPLQPDDEDAVRSWVADAEGADWPAGARVRLDVENGAAEVIAGASKSWTAARLTGRAPVAGGQTRPAWAHPQPAPDLPAPGPVLHLAPDASLALIQLSGHLAAQLTSIATAAIGASQRTASEAVAQVGQTSRTQASQLGGLATTVAKSAEAQVGALTAATEGRVDALMAAAQSTAEAAGLEAQVGALLEAASAPEKAQRATVLQQGLQVLGGVLAGAKLTTAPAAAAAPAPAAAPVVVEAAQPAAPAPAPAVATLSELLQRAAAGDLDARAEVRAAVGTAGGLPGVAWLGEHG